MNQETLEARVERLERQMDLLLRGRANDRLPARDDWMQTVGMFRGDPVFQQMIEEARRLREEDRRRTRETTEPDPA